MEDAERVVPVPPGSTPPPPDRPARPQLLAFASSAPWCQRATPESVGEALPVRLRFRVRRERDNYVLRLRQASGHELHLFRGRDSGPGTEQQGGDTGHEGSCGG